MVWGKPGNTLLINLPQLTTKEEYPGGLIKSLPRIHNCEEGLRFFMSGEERRGLSFSFPLSFIPLADYLVTVIYNILIIVR